MRSLAVCLSISTIVNLRVNIIDLIVAYLKVKSIFLTKKTNKSFHYGASNRKRTQQFKKRLDN
jgi:hypothetical protein